MEVYKMSILQEYESIRKEIGQEKYNCIERYLSENPDLFLSDIYYNREHWNKFEEWYNTKTIVVSDGFNGHTISCFINPIDQDETSLKLRVAEPGKEYMFKWVNKHKYNKTVKEGYSRL
jgi:hypothetical protein